MGFVPVEEIVQHYIIYKMKKYMSRVKWLCMIWEVNGMDIALIKPLHSLSMENLHKNKKKFTTQFMKLK